MQLLLSKVSAQLVTSWHLRTAWCFIIMLFQTPSEWKASCVTSDECPSPAMSAHPADFRELTTIATDPYHYGFMSNKPADIGAARTTQIWVTNVCWWAPHYQTSVGLGSTSLLRGSSIASPVDGANLTLVLWAACCYRFQFVMPHSLNTHFELSGRKGSELDELLKTFLQFPFAFQLDVSHPQQAVSLMLCFSVSLIGQRII